MTIARACYPPIQGSCQRLACRWWIAQHPPAKFGTEVSLTGSCSPEVSYNATYNDEEEGAGCFPPGHRSGSAMDDPRVCRVCRGKRRSIVRRSVAGPCWSRVLISQPGCCVPIRKWSTPARPDRPRRRRSVSPNYE